MQRSVINLPPGLAGTDQTVRAIGRLVRESVERPVVRAKVIEILRCARVDSRSLVDKGGALWFWVSKNISYLPDPPAIETVQAPDLTLRMRAGDCDDHVTLLGSFFFSISIPFRFRVIGPHPDEYQHIFIEIYDSGCWLPVDTTGGHAFGERAPAAPAEKVYYLKGGPPALGFDPGVIPAAAAEGEGFYDAGADLWKQISVWQEDPTTGDVTGTDPSGRYQITLPKIALPPGIVTISPQVTAEAARAGFSELIASPPVWIGLGLLTLFLFKSRSS